MHYLTMVNSVPCLSWLHYLIMVSVVKQWVQLWDPVLDKYGLNCHMRIVWFPWLPNSLSYSHVDWCKFWTSLITLNICHFDSWSNEIKNYSKEVTFNVKSSLLNVIKIYQFVQKLLLGGGGQTDRWSHKLHFLFLSK